MHHFSHLARQAAVPLPIVGCPPLNERPGFVEQQAVAQRDILAAIKCAGVWFGIDCKLSLSQRDSSIECGRSPRWKKKRRACHEFREGKLADGRMD
jgi:hypothetical protein